MFLQTLSLHHLCWNYLEHNEANRDTKLSSSPRAHWRREVTAHGVRPSPRHAGDRQPTLEKLHGNQIFETKHTFNTAESWVLLLLIIAWSCDYICKIKYVICTKRVVLHFWKTGTIPIISSIWTATYRKQKLVIGGSCC